MSQTIVKEGFDQSPPGAAKAPGRETPDFAALAKLFPKWDATDLEVLWEQNDEIATIAKFRYFLTYASSNGLDPLKDEVVASKRWNSVRRRYEVTPIVKIGVLRKRRAEQCDGIDPFEFEEDPSGKVRWPLAVSGKIYRKGAKNPFCAKIWFSEYAPLDENGYVTPLWANKGHLLSSAALEAQLTRLGFYDLVGDMKIDEETQRGEEAPQAEAKPAEDEYAVGEKQPAAVRPADTTTETKPVELETKQPVTLETKQPVNGAPAPPAETKSSGQKAAEKFWDGKEASPESPQIKYGIRQVVVVDGKQELRPVDDPLQSHQDSAVLSARAMANAKGQAFVVVKLVDGKIDIAEGNDGVVAVCNPPAPKEKPKPKAVAHAEAAKALGPLPAAAPPSNQEEKQEVATATAAAEPTPDFDLMIASISKATGLATKDAHQLIKRYLGAYLNIPRDQPTPKDRATLLPGIHALHSKGDAVIKELALNPEALGIRLSGRKDRLDEEFDALNWPASVRELARKVMEQKGMTAEQFIEWIKVPCAGNTEAGTAMPIAAMDVAALEIFFPLFLLVAGRAFELADLALANGESVTHAYQNMVTAGGVPIDKWDRNMATRALDIIAKSGAGGETKPAPAPPVDDVDSFMDAGLPFES